VQDLDADRELGLLDLDLEALGAQRGEHGAAHARSDLDRLHREALVRAARLDLERLEAARHRIARDGDRSRVDLVHLARHHEQGRRAGDAEQALHRREALARVGVERVDDDAPAYAIDVELREILELALQVLPELLLEERPVRSLEADFVVADVNETHSGDSST